jgi:flagellar FliJ protein
VKRFEFNLDGVLRVKKQLERLAELEQQKAQQAVADARARADELKQRLTSAADSMAARVGQAVDASRWVTAYELTERLGQQIDAAETDLQFAEKKLSDARTERARVASEVEALRTLRQQQWDKWRQEAEKAGQEQLDEVGLRRWMAARATLSGAA